MSPTKTERQYAVVFICGKDHPGLIAQASAIMKDDGLNIEECVCHTIGDRVSLFVLVSGTREQIQAAKKNAVPEIKKSGRLKVWFERARNPSYPVPMCPSPWQVRIDAPDKRGLLRATSEFLAERGIDVWSYQGEQYTRADGKGKRLAFAQTITLRVPKTLDAKKLDEELQRIKKKEGWFKVVLTPVPRFGQPSIFVR